jgi:hypothetical protein
VNVTIALQQLGLFGQLRPPLQAVLPVAGFGERCCVFL